MNAGVDINGFEPVTINELIENNAQFKHQSLISAQKNTDHEDSESDVDSMSDADDGQEW